MTPLGWLVMGAVLGYAVRIVAVVVGFRLVQHWQWFPWAEVRGWHHVIGYPREVRKAWVQIGRLQVVLRWHAGKWY